MIKKKKKKNTGFTLVETLIAIAILMISVAAPLSLAAKGLEVIAISKDHIVADFLAQEAFEWIKNKTDYNKNSPIGTDPLINGLNECILADDGSGNGCIVDYTDSLSSYNGQVLKIQDGIYSYNSGGIDTKFKRYVKIKKYRDTITSHLDEISVEVTVEWEAPSGTQKYIYQSNITNW